MNDLKAVIFDMDGVLVDSEPIQLKAMNKVLAKYNVNLSESHWKFAVGKRTLDTVNWLIERFQIESSPDQIIKEKNLEYRKLIKSEVTLIRGVKTVLEAFKERNLLLAVASSSVKEDIELILNKFSIVNYFHSIVSGDQVRNGKPSPDIFLRASEKLNVPPSSALVIEDTEVGVQAAKSAGMICVAIPGKFSEHQNFSQADHVYDDILLILSRFKDGC